MSSPLTSVRPSEPAALRSSYTSAFVRCLPVYCLTLFIVFLSLRLLSHSVFRLLYHSVSSSCFSRCLFVYCLTLYIRLSNSFFSFTVPMSASTFSLCLFLYCLTLSLHLLSYCLRLLFSLSLRLLSLTVFPSFPHLIFFLTLSFQILSLSLISSAPKKISLHQRRTQYYYIVSNVVAVLHIYRKPIKISYTKSF